MLTADGLSFGYAGSDLFSDVTLRVGLGGSLAILGPSGSGKSTLLSILGGQLEPRGGHVQMFGRPVNAREAQLAVAWIAQSLNMLGRRSVIENAKLLGLIDGDDPVQLQQRCQSLLEELGLGELTDRQARDLSGGEKQRTTVARALSSRRPIVLADEPTNQLDRDSAERAISLLVRNAAEAERVLIVVTHDREVARRCDQVLSLR